MKNIFDIIKNEKYCITGTTAYELPRYTPNDIDICIMAKDKIHGDEILKKIYNFFFR